MTPLHFAAASGKLASVRDVLGQKPDVNARTQPNGFTPLHTGVSGTDSQERKEIVKLLYAAGADLELKTYDKNLTPLQLAAMRGKPMCVDALLQCGANVHAVEGNGATALHGAAFNGFIEVSNLLLRAGADPRCTDKHGNSPITLAKSGGYTHLCDILAGIS
ncbi:MAG: ankyrin repeat domain-containing protein [Chlorobium sp.]